MIKYFAYGSNMDLNRITDRIDRCPEREPATLSGYKLRFNKRAKGNPREGYANIEQCDRELPGVIYDLTEDELKRIDCREGVHNGHYMRRLVHVKSSTGLQLEATVHVACDEWVEKGLLPSKEYLNHLLAGAELLPDDHVQWLQQQDVLDSSEGGDK